MKKTKTVAAIVAALALCLSLAACGGKNAPPPTAEDLVAGIAEKTANCRADISMEIEATLSGEDLGGFDGEMTVGLSADMSVETDGKASHLDGDVEIDVLGMTQSQAMETYSVQDDDGNVATYTYDDEAKAWSYAPGGDAPGMAGGVDPSSLSGLSMTEEKDAYVVTGKTTLDGTGMADLAEGVAGKDADASLDVELRFDKETRNPISATMSMDSGAGALSKMEVRITYSGFGEASVEIPSEALEAADELDPFFGQ